MVRVLVLFLHFAKPVPIAYVRCTAPESLPVRLCSAEYQGNRYTVTESAIVGGYGNRTWRKGRLSVALGQLRGMRDTLPGTQSEFLYIEQ